MISDQINKNQIITDDLALSAYLKMKGYPLIESNRRNSKSLFTFEIDDGRGSEVIRLEFINSQFLRYYNELRNLKKII